MPALGAWPLFCPPNESHPVIAHLTCLYAMWQYQLTLTTFVVTFFLQQAVAFWRTVYATSRQIQGRYNDIGMLLATHAARDEDGSYTPEARQLLEDVGRHVRLSHLLFWAAIEPAASAEEAAMSELLSPAGLDRLQRSGGGVITPAEQEALTSSGLTGGWLYAQVLEWVLVRVAAAREAPRAMRSAGAGFERTFLDKVCALRGCMGKLPDDLAARMPLAYVHIVQVLVDSLLYITPFAIYPKIGAFSVFLTAILTLFYRGFLELSKSFLDPFGNLDPLGDREDAGPNMQVAVLIAETNAGSTRWLRGASAIPFDSL